MQRLLALACGLTILACNSTSSDSGSSLAGDGYEDSESGDGGGSASGDAGRDEIGRALGPVAETGEEEECLIGNDGAGHDQFDGRPYDILNYNCHSAANAGVRNSPSNTGILVCGGQPDQGSPAHHTYNYRVYADKTVFYNWGQTCESSATVAPPDVHDDQNLTCIAQFCGNQFDPGEQRALEPGQLVEEPGPLYCSETESGKASCDTCCQYRGKYWDLIQDDLRPTDRTFAQFMEQCYAACFEKFR
jgi:hypothetical protein